MTLSVADVAIAERTYPCFISQWNWNNSNVNLTKKLETLSVLEQMIVVATGGKDTSGFPNLSCIYETQVRLELSACNLQYLTSFVRRIQA
jgi:hypothetical protein